MAIIEEQDVEDSWGEFYNFEDDEDNEDVHWLTMVIYDESWDEDFPEDYEFSYVLLPELCYGKIF